MYDNLQKIDVFPMLSLLIHDHVICFHVFISSLISSAFYNLQCISVVHILLDVYVDITLF